MIRLLTLGLSLTLTWLIHAADTRAPNTLTSKEIAEGWLLLFDGETTFGWKIDGEAKVENGVLILGGTKETHAEPTVWLPRSMAVHLETDWRGEKPPRLLLFGPLFTEDGGGASLLKENQGKFTSQSVDGAVLGRARPPMRFLVPAGSTLMLRNVRARPTKMEPLFNGKDLTGWKVFQGNPKQEKSTWSVTKEGWLNVKNGPGDLQTEKQFGDFVLQLDCISNGTHLNSGLFFRCQPGKYQQGYEAQIRNQFTDKPTQKYQVDDYDPQTNKLLGKKEVLSSAVDYGTGAIYRRIPARKGIAKDREWFTMTVVARGRHFATFVNGLQVVDWTDHRPASDNARTGYRAAAGALSIQGHDPTTDLSFRHLRVAPLLRKFDE